MRQEIEAIIFDLGGVLYDIDPSLSFQAFGKLGIKDFGKYYNLQEQIDLFDLLETGKIDRKSFAEGINKVTGLSFTPEQVVEAWNALLIGIGQETIHLLKDLRERYRTYLISNTNEMHMEAIDKQMQAQYGLKKLAELFDKAYFSHEVGLRKPGIEIYEHVIREQNLDPAKTLFIDDNEDNINGASKAGLQVIHKDRDEPLLPLLEKAGIV